MNRMTTIFLGTLTLAFLLVLAAPALGADMKGKINSVDPDKKQFVVQDEDGKNWTFHANEDTKLFLDNNVCKLADLQVGYAADVNYERDGDRLIVREARCRKN